MSFKIEGFATIAQRFLSRQIASNFYKKAPFLAILGALTLGNQKKDSLEIGRPGSTEILSGKMIDPIERKRLGSVNSYCPRIQKFVTSNSKWMGTRDTMPTVSAPTTTSHGQANQAAAEFMWSDLVTPCLIWHEDKERAGEEGTKEGQAIAIGQVINEATEVAMQEHIDEINDKVWNGNPADQNADLWNQPLGIIEALKNNNTYGGVSRTVETTWQAQVDSTTTAVDVKRLIDRANIGLEINIKGDGIDLMLVHKDLYETFKAQVLAGGASFGTVLKDGIPNMGKLGVKKELLQVDNVVIGIDAKCPANTVCGFTTSTWKFIVKKTRNFKMGKFKDLSEEEGGKDADQAYIRTRAILACDNPFLNVRFSAIGT